MKQDKLDPFTLQLEELFGLTGGELESTPWKVKSPGGREHTFNYWYKGASDAVDDRKLPEHGGTYITVVSPGDEPNKLIDGKREWNKVAEIGGSQEAECPFRNEDPVNDSKEDCIYCDESPGKPHRYIYWGEPWMETVYYQGKFLQPVLRLRRARRLPKLRPIKKYNRMFRMPGKEYKVKILGRIIPKRKKAAKGALVKRVAAGKKK